MSNKRVPLSQRRSGEQRGVDAIFEPTITPESAAVPAAQKPVKVTCYIRPEQVITLEQLQLAERQRTGKRRDKSELIQEALDLLFTQYGLTSS